MASVPGELGQGIFQREVLLVFRVEVSPLEVLGSQAPQERHPPLVQGLQQGHRDLDRHDPVVGQLGPAVLGKGLDRRVVLCDCLLYTSDAADA